jgi:hypothetical protein
VDGALAGSASNWVMDTPYELAAGTYRCIISNTSGSVTSNGAVLTTN